MEIVFLTSLIASLIGMGVVVFGKIPVLTKLPRTISPRPNIKEVALSFIKIIKNNTPLKKFSGELFLQKVLSKIRVLVLKIDNKTFHWLQRLRENAQKHKFDKNDNYWKEIKGSVNQTHEKSETSESGGKRQRRKRPPA